MVGAGWQGLEALAAATEVPLRALLDETEAHLYTCIHLYSDLQW